MATIIKCPSCHEALRLREPDGSVFQVCTCLECGAVFDYDERGPEDQPLFERRES